MASPLDLIVLVHLIIHVDKALINAFGSYNYLIDPAYVSSGLEAFAERASPSALPDERVLCLLDLFYILQEHLMKSTFDLYLEAFELGNGLVDALIENLPQLVLFSPDGMPDLLDVLRVLIILLIDDSAHLLEVPILLHYLS